MKFTFFHNNINVLDLDKSVEFYKKALGLEVTKEFHAPDGSFKLVISRRRHNTTFTGADMASRHGPPYDLGDNESHLAFHVDDHGRCPGTSQRNGLRVFRKPGHGNLFHQ